MAIAVVLPARAPATGQARTATADRSTPHRTPWGDPDLQGIWDYRTFTPFERPDELAGKAFFATEEEAAEFEQQTAQRRDNDPFTVQDRTIFYDRGTRLTEGRRTSLLVDPRDGRLPPLTPKARERRSAMLAAGDHGPEDRTLYERCIVAITNGAPLVPAVVYFNHNVQLFQTPEYVVLLNEMIHDARIVPLDRRPHVGAHIRLWMGDSRGRWEGNTLVVDTTNFNDTGWGFSRRGGSETHLVEHFTRVDANTLLYEFTVDDPATWTTPWSVAVHMTKTKGPIFEYACHEGNYRAMVVGSQQDGTLDSQNLSPLSCSLV